MERTIQLLKDNDELKIIDVPVSTELEIAYISYLETKKPGGGRALLFTKPIKNNKIYKMPVLTNLYGSKKRMELIFDKNLDDISARILTLLKPSAPKGFWQKLAKLRDFWSLRSVFVSKTQKKSPAQELVYLGKAARLEDLPILKTWEFDGGSFITMGQVYTTSLDGKINNLGMYRLQKFPDNTLGLHWQIHKDSTAIFEEYKKAGVKMPVSIAIGGDPLYAWCATAPLPKGFFELMLYGFIRSKRARLTKCVSNELYVPSDADIVIEGFADPAKTKPEGPFGDHTGYYTQVEAYPFLEITAITMKKNPVFCATVVGKPPLEDKYMGYPTERIFLPLLQTSIPDLIDYRLPENGVFHNLIICKIRTRFPGQSKQIMHALWGVGQMSFVKHAIFVGEDLQDLHDDAALARYVLNRIDTRSFSVSSGIIDALDHSSVIPLVGGKLAIDATNKTFGSNAQAGDLSAGGVRGVGAKDLGASVAYSARGADLKAGASADLSALDPAHSSSGVWGALSMDLSASATSNAAAPGAQAMPLLKDAELLSELQKIQADVLEVRQIFTDSANPVCLVKVRKTFGVMGFFKEISALELSSALRLVFVVDDDNNDLNNLYMLIWRITNNFDSERDFFAGSFLGFDATTKTAEHDGYNRAWPMDTDCNAEILDNLRKRGLCDFDDEFLRKWQITKPRAGK
ncbi:MAG: menaquinone biosynthesis decarboxylase [Helicobacteraceae bacterium]